MILAEVVDRSCSARWSSDSAAKENSSTHRLHVHEASADSTVAWLVETLCNWIV